MKRQIAELPESPSRLSNMLEQTTSFPLTPALSPQERILRNSFSHFDPLNRDINKVGQASGLPSERVSTTLPIGGTDGDRRRANSVRHGRL